MKQLDGWKTKITAIVTMVLNMLSMFDIVSLPPEQMMEINAALIALIGAFLHAKMTRKMGDG